MSSEKRRSRRDLDVLGVIAVGGGLGSIARYGLARAMPTPAGGFPWATLITNVVGCAVLGGLMYLVLEVWPPSRYRRPFFGVGVCGGFTTFSTAMVETRGLLDGGHLASAGIYLPASVLLGVLAVLGGAALARAATRGRLRPDNAPTAAEPAVAQEGQR
ncbi:fluoride efflux transporter FluC [Streptacidiphilus jiangxiensis]|uniref:Fluoride-specific ion channel FluC n=1 Tax=Streptacidiphilus jiangxiensis TaxID=235985 RepID=A0A1H7JYY1_STRJI|nr:CrcB family protein [Streptacidiphilus jiangxiensis]SEK79496.1 CrcB protein [Streptacidiphilus jiangxiensis]